MCATHFAEERADVADLLQRGDHPVFLVEFVDEAVDPVHLLLVAILHITVYIQQVLQLSFVVLSCLRLLRCSRES